MAFQKSLDLQPDNEQAKKELALYENQRRKEDEAKEKKKGGLSSLLKRKKT